VGSHSLPLTTPDLTIRVVYGFCQETIYLADAILTNLTGQMAEKNRHFFEIHRFAPVPSIHFNRDMG
jgi:hypothetical protein